jgi:hypothetical protein
VNSIYLSRHEIITGDHSYIIIDENERASAQLYKIQRM